MEYNSLFLTGMGQPLGKEAYPHTEDILSLAVSISIITGGLIAISSIFMA